MPSPKLSLVPLTPLPGFGRPERDPRPIGRILVDNHRLNEANLKRGLLLQRRLAAPLGDILVHEGYITEADLRDALIEQHKMPTADMSKIPPDPEAAHLLAADVCVEFGVVPWRRFGDSLLVVTSRPDRFARLLDGRKKSSLSLVPVLGEAHQIRAAQQILYGKALIWRAERRVMAHMSCRSFASNTAKRYACAGVLFAVFLAALAIAPGMLWQTLAAVAIITMILSVGLKVAAATAHLMHERKRAGVGAADPGVTLMRLPKVSMLVPLLQEREIASRLIERLSQLTYPKALLDVVLVLEETDTVTRETLAQTELPPWIRVIRVPEGTGLKTKPRALNYALDFCRGSIVGIWDAEDAPEPDQIEKVVGHFHNADPEVVCLQGQLDYYNPRSNWIARCFTIEYAAWWRLIMPGLQRLGIVIPLGGTTLFFRRKELEDLGGWDAHNVTEDADLGLRLARAGYRTELIPTVTFEEANHRAWPWVRQRSRWLKGFAMTWAVHMRRPLQLWRDLGTYKFIGVQLFYLTALSQFLLAPVFWSFWLILFGVKLGAGAWASSWALIGVFALAETATLVLHAIAVRRPEHRHLIPWTPLMILYFPMGCVAMYKALLEVVHRPFFWDKTQHGIARQPEV